jgi:hypothetical protein
MTLRNDPLFQTNFGQYLKDLKDEDLVELCHWPGNVVEVCTLLLCHAFHCPSVHCCFLSQWQLTKEKDSKEKKDKEET